MISVYVVKDGFVLNLYLAKMPKKSMIAVVLACVVSIFFCLHVVYAGFLIVVNVVSFDRNII